MSFFDEADEPPRRTPRSQPRRRPPTGGRGRPPGDQQAIQVRRLIAGGVILVIVILMAVGIHSCQVSARNSALKDYNTSVFSLIQRSDNTGTQLFSELTGASSSNNVTNVSTQIGSTLQNARSQYQQAQGLSVPSQMSGAQQDLLLTLKMRRDGIATIAANIQPALGGTTSRDAINQIATAMAHFYASDVIYKSYALPQIVAALHAAGISVGGTSGQQLQGGQFLSDLGWVQPSVVASKLGSHLQSSGGGKAQPGLHGHSLNSVSVGSTTLQPGATNTLSASPAPTFTLSVTNGGHFNETTSCTVTVQGANDTASTPLSTTAGQSTTCSVTLPSAPTPGTYQVTATVKPVPGETNTKNNTLTYTVVFQ